MPKGASYSSVGLRGAREHGHHAYGELDVALPRWAESPDYVLGLLRGYLATPPEAGPITLGRRRNAERAQLLGECRARLGFVRGLVFEEVLRRARGGLVLRENFKSEVIRVTAGVRRLLLTLGGRLTQHGVLHAPEDIFFFELDELPQLCAPGAGDRFRATVERRRAEYGFFRRLKPPPVIVGRYEPTAEVAGPRRAVEHPAAHELRGLAVSPGVATGPARVLSRPDGTERVRPGEIPGGAAHGPGLDPAIPYSGCDCDRFGRAAQPRQYRGPRIRSAGGGQRRTGDRARANGADFARRWRARNRDDTTGRWSVKRRRSPIPGENRLDETSEAQAPAVRFGYGETGCAHTDGRPAEPPGASPPARRGRRWAACSRPTRNGCSSRFAQSWAIACGSGSSPRT